MQQKEKPWKTPVAVLPWFVRSEVRPFLQTLSHGKRLGKAEKPKEKTIKGRIKSHLRSPSLD